MQSCSASPCLQVGLAGTKLRNIEFTESKSRPMLVVVSLQQQPCAGEARMKQPALAFSLLQGSKSSIGYECSIENRKVAGSIPA